jgi:acylphosphatase
MDGNHLVRREQTYRGRVQGVGFRYTTLQISVRYGVTGFVRNMIDGSVNLVAEGERDTVNEFINDVTNRLSQHIRAVHDEASDFQGEFNDFSIRP